MQVFVDDLPTLDPVIFHELTTYGWRGLTAHGEVLEVRSSNGHAIKVPSELMVTHHGKPVGRREVRNDTVVNIDSYLEHFNRAVKHSKANRAAEG